MGKSTISMAIFHCYVSSPEGIPIWGVPKSWSYPHVRGFSKWHSGAMSPGASATCAKVKTQRCFDVIFVTFYRIFSLGDLIWSCMFFQDFKGVLMIFRGVYMIIWFCGGIIHLVSSIKTGDKHGDPAWWCKMDTRWYWRAVCQLESITILKKGIHHRSKWGMASRAMWIYW